MTVNEATSLPQSAQTLDQLIASFDQIKTLYAIEGYTEVFQMMLDQSAIAPLVLEAHGHIRALFPTEKLGLKVTTDVEYRSWRSMWLSIYTSAEVEEAFEKLKEIDRGWWLQATIDAPKNDLHIDLEWM